MAAPGSAARLERILAVIPPASGAVVMGTGIVSVGLSLDGHETLSRVLLVICASLWIALGLLLAGRAWRDRDRVRRESHSPAALTGVAGTEVLGTRLTMLGWNWAGIALLAGGLALWLALLAPVLSHWVVPTVGVSFVVTVSTESLAVLAAAVAAGERARWLVIAALVPFLLGLGFYALVISRFDFGQLRVGHGDHWITGGALAISTLAAAKITLAAAGLHTLSDLHSALKAVAVVLWCATLLWLPVLVVVEARWPRWAYDVRRWSTVFPVGMYAACSLVTGSVARVSAITDFARGWVWVGLAVWLLVGAATLNRGRELVGPDSPTESV